MREDKKLPGHRPRAAEKLLEAKGTSQASPRAGTPAVPGSRRRGRGRGAWLLGRIRACRGRWDGLGLAIPSGQPLPGLRWGMCVTQVGFFFFWFVFHRAASGTPTTTLRTTLGGRAKAGVPDSFSLGFPRAWWLGFLVFCFLTGLHYSIVHCRPLFQLSISKPLITMLP